MHVKFVACIFVSFVLCGGDRVTLTKHFRHLVPGWYIGNIVFIAYTPVYMR